MKYKVKITERVEREIDVELPYYYEHNVGGDDYERMVYGCIEATRTTMITLGRSYSYSGRVSAEIEILDGTPDRVGSYFDPQYSSTEAEFLKARAQALEMLQGREAGPACADLSKPPVVR